MNYLYYNPTKCEHCQKQQAGTPSYVQILILLFLTALFVIPGLIYLFVAKPSRCYECGISLRGNHTEYLFYKKDKCNNCQCEQGGFPLRWQLFLYKFLMCLFVIPGLIYLIVARPKSCFKCGLSMNYSGDTIQASSNAQINSTVNNQNPTVMNQNTPNNNYYNNHANEYVKNYDSVSNVPIVQISNLTKQYKGRNQPAISNISFNIYPGHFHAFIGANGAGKTTTIKSIIGAYSNKKYKGVIKIKGFSNESVSAKLLVGYIPEEAKFPKKMSTRNYLIKMAMLSGKTSSQAKTIAEGILKDTKLEAVANKCPNSFSSGQKKKVLLAQALINDPEVLIMDEPAANLDPIARDDLFHILTNLQKRGKAIFLSSHILDEIGKYATFVTILDGGKIVYNGQIGYDTDLNVLYRNYVKLGSNDSGIMG